MASQILVNIISAIIFFGFFVWLSYCVLWVLRKTGITKKWRFWRLKRRFKHGFKFDDDIVDICNKFLDEDWKYEEVKLFIKHNPLKHEILYTYFMVKELRKEQLKGGL